MTQEEIMETWDSAAKRFFAPTQEEMVKMYRNNKTTALQKLIAKYRRFSILGLVMALMSTQWFLLLRKDGITDNGIDIIVTIVFTVYFALCSMMDYWLYKGVSDINCYTMSVSQVAEKAIYYKKKHLQCMMILIPFAFVVLGVLAYAFRADIYVILGMVVGFIVGAALGFRQYLDFMAQYKKLSEE